MNKLAPTLSLIAAAALAAGCATEEPRTTTQPVTSTTGKPVKSGTGAPVAQLRPGTGTVEAITAVPFVGSSATGASAPGNASRLSLRMSDGTVQLLDYEGRDLTVGQRVEITGDGFIRKL